MKTLLRRLIIYAVILFLLPRFVPGFSFSGSLFGLLIASLVLTLLMLVIKPILSIVSFPINLITLGLFSFIINAGILYLFIILVNTVSLVPFSYPATHLFGLAIPELSFNIFFAYIYTAFVITTIDSLFKWLVK